MAFLSYFIPIIGVIIFYAVLDDKAYATQMSLILVGASSLVTFVAQWLLKRRQTKDVEFLGDNVVAVTYYEDWDEWIVQIETREVPAGTDSNGHTIYRTETVDRSHREYHPEHWTYSCHAGEYSMSFRDYETMRKILKTERVFKDMHRDYYTKDGDAWVTFWDNSIETCIPLTHKHKYINKVIGSNSIFKFATVREQERVDNELVDYPEVGYDQNTVINLNVPDNHIREVRLLNALCGPQYQFRLFVIGFKGKGPEVAELQRAYWEGGNKNELVVCLGMSDDDKKVEWCHCFSWCDEPKLEVKTRDYFIQHPELDLIAYCNWLKEHLPTDWKRKEFKDFDYIRTHLNRNGSIWLSIITFVFGAIFVWITLSGGWG